jgi:catechol 2,3-dioxygenase-like lactoylglutathione lyase family enzyme
MSLLSFRRLHEHAIEEDEPMSEPMPKTQIVDVAGVSVPVADQQQALSFYVDKLGFEVHLDVPMEVGGRWIQVAPRGGSIPIALVASDATGVATGITLATADADADHADMVANGVDADEVLRWPGVPTMFAFRDQDGNELKVMEVLVRPTEQEQ